MQRETINFGIDLGTTNSEIALFTEKGIEVFKNNEGFEYTPSAVWIDSKGRLWVGRQAKEKLEDDPENAFSEFKLMMGKNIEYVFTRTGKRMKPEELSAEVLKELKKIAKQRTGKDINAAVITVPAAFEAPQIEATKRAAQLAGLIHTPLLQEPVAAALAYGFQNETNNTFWLVYDFGGGTFDSALIQVKDGIIQVVNHSGDNHLGGKLIDWAIVDELFIPALTKEYKLKDFRRGNIKWRSTIAKLKLKAEEAKIRLSTADSIDVIIDYLCQDDNGNPVRFKYKLYRKDVECLAEPLILRTINICKTTLADVGLEPKDIEKVILVGRPTLMPYLREVLAQKLGIPLEFNIDPLTVVVRGAALFAGTQMLPIEEPKTIPKGQFVIELKYEHISPDTEPPIGGKVISEDVKDFSGFTIEFVNTTSKSPWRSGKIGLSPDGTFITNLWAEKGHPNTFKIELCDPSGRRLETTPSSITYTVAMVVTSQPLIHSIGVATVDNTMEFFFEKGTPLPAKKMKLFRTAYEVKKGRSSDVIRVPVMEGESKRADLNRIIGTLEIKAEEVDRDLPIGSEAEVTIEIDESRLIKVKAYIPFLDKEYEDVLKLGYDVIDLGKLKDEFEKAKELLFDIRIKVGAIKDPAVKEILEGIILQIDQENILYEIDLNLSSALSDPDAGEKARNRILDLKALLAKADEILKWLSMVDKVRKFIIAKSAKLEDISNWPTEVHRFKKFIFNLIFDAENIVIQYGDISDKDKFKSIKSDLEENIEKLEENIKELESFRVQILDKEEILPVLIFQELETHKNEMRDSQEAEALINAGYGAISRKDYDELRRINVELYSLFSEIEVLKRKNSMSIWSTLKE